MITIDRNVWCVYVCVLCTQGMHVFCTTPIAHVKKAYFEEMLGSDVEYTAFSFQTIFDNWLACISNANTAVINVNLFHSRKKWNEKSDERL